MFRLTFNALLTVVVVGLANAGERSQEVLELAFAGSEGTIDVRLDSDAMGFRLQDLAEGESRTIVTDAGQTVTLTRSGAVIALEVEGERFELPAQPRRLQGGPGPWVDGQEGLVILSVEPLDEVRQQTIRAALEAAGINETVRFHARPAGSEDEHIVIIHKDIDADGEHTLVRKHRHGD